MALFGAGDAGLAGRRLVVDGRRLQALRFGRLALLVAYVDPLEYAPDEIERRRGRESWLWNEARIHERAVERAATHAAVVPARLLTVFPDWPALEQAAREQAARWSRSLGRFATQRECVLHVFAGPHSPPGREPYLVRVTERAARRGRAPAIQGEPRVCEHVAALRRACSEATAATRRIEPSSERGALLSAAFLTGDAGLDSMRRIVERSAEAGASLGVTAYLEGPRAPFTFV
ncbi:MAG: GvpL/GvpF family gas vesicle protein [Vulcanimicrobiaceae bacterium]